MLRKVSKVKFFGKFEVTSSLLAHIGGSNDGGSDPVVTWECNIYSFDNTRQTRPRAIRHEAGQTPPVFTEKLPSATEPTDYFSVNVEMWTSSSEWRVTTWSCFNCHVQKVQDHKINVCVEIQLRVQFDKQGERNCSIVHHLRFRWWQRYLVSGGGGDRIHGQMVTPLHDTLSSQTEEHWQ